MAFGNPAGLTSNGPSADGNKALISAAYSLPPGYQILRGQVFKRNLYAVTGSNYEYPQYAGTDQCVLPSSPLGGPVMGVYDGPTITNTSSIAEIVQIPLRREGICPVRLGAQATTPLNIGTLISVSNSTLTTVISPTISDLALNPLSLAPLAGIMVGYATAQNINTNIVGAVAAGNQTFSVVNGFKINSGTPLIVDYGTQYQETITPTAAPTFVAQGYVAVTLSGSVAAGNTLTLTIGGVSVTYTLTAADSTLAIAGTSFAKYINASPLVQGIGAWIQPIVAGIGTATFYFADYYATPAHGGVPMSSTSSGSTSVALTTTPSSVSNNAFPTSTYPTINATFQYPHQAGASIIGQQTAYSPTASTLLIPGSLNGAWTNNDTILVDLQISSAG